MAPLLKLLLSVTFLCLLSSFMAMSRPVLDDKTSSMLLYQSNKLKEQGSATCWDSLLELQSCTGEVVMFFLNGETYLGPNCCDAIRTIEKQCWPNMLQSVGINSEEGDILVGYCDASDLDPDLLHQSLQDVAPVPTPASSHLLYH